MKESYSPLPINGQALCEYANVPFGWFRIAYNGCAALSIYNALLLSGYHIPFSRIHGMLHKWWIPRIFGVRVWEIRRCLKKLEIPFREFSAGDQLSSAMEPGTTAVVMKWNRSVPYCYFTVGEEPLSVLRFSDPFGGAHCMAVSYTVPGKWTVYNRYSNQARPYFYDSFRDFLLFETTFMRGFLIQKKSLNT